MILVTFQRFLLSLSCLIFVSIAFVSCGNSNKKEPLDGPVTPTAPAANLTIEQLDGMIAKEPNNSQYYYERALAYYEMGDLGAALKDFDKTVELEPGFASAFHDRGICRFELEMYDEAMKDFNEAIDLDSAYYEAYFNRALIYDVKQMPKKAIADLTTAISINPDFGDAYYNRGVYLLNTDRKKACADFEKAANLGIQEARATMQEYCK